jgi:hypothetical protein
MDLLLQIELFDGFSRDELWWRITITCMATILINLPFGFWRGGLRKLSFWWFISIHAPVPFVILVRKFHKLELTWELAPILLGAYFVGQLLGRKYYKKRHNI